MKVRITITSLLLFIFFNINNLFAQIILEKGKYYIKPMVNTNDLPDVSNSEFSCNTNSIVVYEDKMSSSPFTIDFQYTFYHKSYMYRDDTRKPCSPKDLGTNNCVCIELSKTESNLISKEHTINREGELYGRIDNQSVNVSGDDYRYWVIWYYIDEDKPIKQGSNSKFRAPNIFDNINEEYYWVLTFLNGEQKIDSTSRIIDINGMDQLHSIQVVSSSFKSKCLLMKNDDEIALK
ncbi:hypothetical protein [Flammeovirga pacifica]|uniref:Uncharacterized protein n=1 Tax=Flammeovirga pacifica TaxID=915059 RepID=A0A1S1Z2J6_FLAPC|nr:hypothetical protein [Flammeovirga pacifica]OHX67498.1 hypothetical protein NH26_14655 [Flammeovirga pacifica]